jgi:GNAT superfamily N-acetyltransferase
VPSHEQGSIAAWARQATAGYVIDMEDRIELKDGGAVTVRPLQPGDGDLLREGYERLSEESRYRRFFTLTPELTGAQLASLLAVDHHDHEALVAIEPERGAAAAVARFVRSATDPEVAEAAIVVADDWQGRGLGGAMLERLVDRARAEGVRRFTALVQAENRRAQDLMAALGKTTWHHDGSTVELDIELPERGIGEVLAEALRVAGRRLMSLRHPLER